LRDKQDVKLRIVRQKAPAPKVQKIVLVREKRFGGAVAELVEQPPITPGKHKTLRFDGTLPIECMDTKKAKPIKDGDGQVIDYRDVTIKGYLSTWGNVDRDGEAVERGAFKETIKTFMAGNPVLLIQHRNNVSDIGGKFTVMREDEKGLYVEAEISNSPALADVRFKLMEGSLKTMSIGGIWHYKEDGRTIFKVDLFEGSLVAIPANPKAIIQVRELNDEDKRRMEELELAA
jgi:HK97 family phage prohead protease